MAGVGAPYHLGDGVAAGRARSHIKRCLADQAAGAQHLPHVGMGAASALGVGRRAAWGPHLLRPSVRVVGPGSDTAGMVGRAPWAPWRRSFEVHSPECTVAMST